MVAQSSKFTRAVTMIVAILVMVAAMVGGIVVVTDIRSVRVGDSHSHTGSDSHNVGQLWSRLEPMTMSMTMAIATAMATSDYVYARDRHNNYSRAQSWSWMSSWL